MEVLAHFSFHVRLKLKRHEVDLNVSGFQNFSGDTEEFDWLCLGKRTKAAKLSFAASCIFCLCSCHLPATLPCAARRIRGSQLLVPC